MQPCDLEQRCTYVVSRLLAANVRFIVVGSWAVRFHGHRDRNVKDLDVLVDFSSEGWPPLRRVLSELGVEVQLFEQLSQRTRPLQTKELDPVHVLTAVGSAFQGPDSTNALLPNRGPMLAVAMSQGDSVAGVSFEEAWAESLETNFSERHQVRVLSKEHLILSKRHTKRPTDADDIERLLAATEE